MPSLIRSTSSRTRRHWLIGQLVATSRRAHGRSARGAFTAGDSADDGAASLGTLPRDSEGGRFGPGDEPSSHATGDARTESSLRPPSAARRSVGRGRDDLRRTCRIGCGHVGLRAAMIPTLRPSVSLTAAAAKAAASSDVGADVRSWTSRLYRRRDRHWSKKLADRRPIMGHHINDILAPRETAAPRALVH